MKILDRYIIRQFLLNYAILLFVLISLFVLVDLVVDLDEFLKAGQARAQGAGAIWATLGVIADYYGPVSILAYVYFWAIIGVGAMGFTFASFIRGGELLAMLSSGQSMYRIAAPVLVTTCLLSLLVVPCQEYLIPVLAPKLARSKSQIVHEQVQGFPVRYAPDGDGNLLSASQFDPEKLTLDELVILVRDDKGQTRQRIVAKSASWNPIKEGWNLSDASMTQRWGPDSDIQTAEPTQVDFFASDLSPKVLLARRARLYTRFLGLGELQELRSNPALKSGQARMLTQVMHGRFSMMVAGVLIQVLALPFFLLREPRNMLQQAVLAAGVCLGAWGASIVMIEMSVAGISAITVAWLPVVILVPISAAMLQSIRT